jgi:CHAT domain-containing protein
LHAAGIYDNGTTPGSKLSDFVIPSYIPTLTALLDASAVPSMPPAPPKLLVVAQSTYSGQNNLPGTKDEVERIEKVVNGAFPVISLIEEHATLENVVPKLQTSNWAHFACHGVQNAIHPTESALLLSGKEKLTLAKLMSLQIPHGDLIFLSACQTAKGDEQLSDEAVHLSAGMLVTGYRGVIATMWSVDDRVAPEMAEEVYQQLKKSKWDSAEAAHALHVAIGNMTGGVVLDDNEWFISWVPFIHMGR